MLRKPMNQDQIIALGDSLRRINQKLLKNSQEHQFTRIWYQGGEPYFDVFFDCLESEVIWFQFTLRGQSITWDKNQPGIETGFTNENNTAESKHPASKIINTDNRANVYFIELAHAILQTRASEPPFDRALDILKKYR